jgi:hypothetical protein
MIDFTRSRTPSPQPSRVVRRRIGAAAGVMALVVSTVLVSSATPSVGAQDGTDTGTTETTVADETLTTQPPVPLRPGRIAYVTPLGEVIVAESDGSNPVVVGQDAVANAAGLAPLAWAPDGTTVAYVRSDQSLVLAPADGFNLEENTQILADDAIVPPDADENILSFVVSSTAIAYIGQDEGGLPQAALIIYEGVEETRRIPLSDPATRDPVGLQFSPLDAYLYLESRDVETAADFTIAIVEPFNGTPFATPFSIDDPVFAPDGAFMYGVARGGLLDQLVRIDANTADFLAVRDQDRICKPMPSPDGQKLAYAAGPNCNEVWVIDSNGANPEQITSNVGGSSSFADGSFSWSLDNQILSHAACKGLEAGAACGGAYWDIPLDGTTPRPRAQAMSVKRESRPLIKPIKLEMDMTGPIDYQGTMLISNDSLGGIIRQPESQVVEARGVDQDDPQRSFGLRLLVGENVRWVSGTMRITDPTSGFEEEVLFMGSIVLQSYRFASLRGLWLKTAEMPMKSGRMDLTLYR